jgi:hypothetical protein
MSSVFKTADGALAFRGGFDSHALSPSKVEALVPALAGITLARLSQRPFR